MIKHPIFKNQYDVIIIGGSYSGLAAAMALGRALRQVLIIDSGEPCNRQTPFSHNFLTQDGEKPEVIAALAKGQVAKYHSIECIDGVVVSGLKTISGFEISLESGLLFRAKKLVFATGINDLMADIPGFADCWGISILHCPYCHGYEVKQIPTGILANGDIGFEFAMLLSNWTNRLTLYTNGKSTLSIRQKQKFKEHQIELVQNEITQLKHHNGALESINFKDGSRTEISVVYARRPFIQKCNIPETMGCSLTDEGYLKVDPTQQTTAPGIYACGDNASRMRTIANAVSMGTTAGIMVNKVITEEEF